VSYPFPLHAIRYYRCGEIFRQYLEVVKNAGVAPIVVFDGFPLPAKAAEQERRQRWAFSFI
jgi:hypothetical protein